MDQELYRPTSEAMTSQSRLASAANSLQLRMHMHQRPQQGQFLQTLGYS